MSSAQDTGRSSARSEDTQNVVQAFDALGTDEKLALLYYIYEKWAIPSPRLRLQQLTQKWLLNFWVKTFMI